MTFLSPTLPENAATFDCIDFGNYGPRGYNSSAISGRICGLSVKEIRPGSGWLESQHVGKSGSTWNIKNSSGKRIGHVTVPSEGLLAQKPEFKQLKFVSEC